MDNNQKIMQISDENIMNTYSRHAIVLKKGAGSVAVDNNNKEYLDVSSGIGVNSLGYCDPGFVKAVTLQLNTIQHVSNYYYNRQPAILAQQLCSKSHFKKVFFGNSGAEANECAIKLARKYSFDKYGKDRNQIITLKNSFHGRTITTLSATGQEDFHNYFFPFTEGFTCVTPNDIYEIKNMDLSHVCAFMLEFIQGEGGINILYIDYVRQIAEICKNNDILLIADEVQTGAGRTGRFYCFEHYNVQPDIATLAKGLAGGLPIGACLCAEKLANTLSAATHGTTFGGNPVSCAGANYVISTVYNDEFLNDVTKKGCYLASKLFKIKGIKSIDYKGLMFGIELYEDNAKETAQKCVENGLLIITAKNKLRMLPPLNISYNELDKAAAILEAVIGGQSKS